MNGDHPTVFLHTVKIFFEELHSNGFSLHEFPSPADDQIASDSSLSLIMESLHQRTSSDQDPNTATFRYLMLLDPTDTEVSVQLFLDLLKNHPSESQNVSPNIISVGGFTEDTREKALADVVLNVKAAMEKGETVMLLNSELVRSAFYDLFNVHFNALPTAEKGKKHYTTNLAIGSLSMSCFVHPNFKLILHLPMSQLESTQIPFLDRYVKCSNNNS